VVLVDRNVIVLFGFAASECGLATVPLTATTATPATADAILVIVVRFDEDFSVVRVLIRVECCYRLFVVIEIVAVEIFFVDEVVEVLVVVIQNCLIIEVINLLNKIFFEQHFIFTVLAHVERRAGTTDGARDAGQRACATDDDALSGAESLRTASTIRENVTRAASVNRAERDILG